MKAVSLVSRLSAAVSPASPLGAVGACGVTSQSDFINTSALLRLECSID